MNKFFFAIIISLSFSIMLSLSVYGQDWNSARLSILSGGNIDFNFRSFSQYENGIQLTNATLLGVTVSNLPDGSALASWDLDFSSYLGQPQLNGDAGGTLPLSVIEIEASNALGLAAATYSAALPLSAAVQNLVTTNIPAHLNTDWSTHQINITYSCGTNAGNNLQDEIPDFYYIEIEFTLEPGF